MTTTATAKWLDDTEQLAWRRLAALMHTLPASMDAQLQRDAGLTLFDYIVLSVLSEEPDQTCRMGRIATRASASLSRLSHVMAKLQSHGWVTRSPLPGNRRVIMVTLTDAGMDKVVSAAPAHLDHVRSIVFDLLTPAQVEQLSGTTAALLTVLDPDFEYPPRF